MKKNHIFSITVLLLSILMYSCEKNAVQKLNETVHPSGAQIKFYHFGTNAPSINFYVGDSKITAITSATGAENVAGLAFGGVLPAAGYSFMSGGAYTFKGQISSTAATDPNLAIVNISGTLENDKFYSLYTSGIYNATTKTSDGFIVEDQLPIRDITKVYLRFVNTISNGTAPMDFYIKNANTAVETKVATNIPYKGSSEFVEVPFGVYEVYARYTGTTVNKISRTGTSNVSLELGRTYTIGSRGDITVTSTTATNRPFLDFTTNR